jgi:hypothetical protein
MVPISLSRILSSFGTFSSSARSAAYAVYDREVFNLVWVVIWNLFISMKSKNILYTFCNAARLSSGARGNEWFTFFIRFHGLWMILNYFYTALVVQCYSHIEQCACVPVWLQNISSVPPIRNPLFTAHDLDLTLISEAGVRTEHKVRRSAPQRRPTTLSLVFLLCICTSAYHETLLR